MSFLFIHTKPDTEQVSFPQIRLGTSNSNNSGHHYLVYREVTICLETGAYWTGMDHMDKKLESWSMRLSRLEIVDDSLKG